MVRIKGKKGQFYLLTAIILSTVLWASLPSKQEETIVRTTFDSLRENFITESDVVINNAIRDGEDLEARYEDFVSRFLIYSRSKQVRFGVVYMILTPDGLLVGNHIGEEVTVEVHGETEALADASTGNYDHTQTAIIYLGNTPYSYSFGSEPVQFKALFKQIS